MSQLVRRNPIVVFRPSGVNDHTQFIAAMANESPGTLFWLKPGVYDFDAGIEIPKDSYFHFYGEKFSKGSTGGAMFKASNTITNLISYTGNTDPSTNADLAHDIQFTNITFNGNLTTTNDFLLTNTDTIKIYDCRIINATNSIVTEWDSSVDPVASTIPGGLLIDHCIISANSGIGLDLQNQTQCWISNSWFTGTSVDKWVRIASSNKIKFDNLEFNTAGVALSFEDTATTSTNNIVVNNCIFEVGSGNKAWADSRTNAGSTKISITGSTLGSGVTYDTLVNTRNVLNNSNTYHSQGNVTGTPTFDRVNGREIAATLTGNITPTITAGGYAGDELILRLTQDGTGSRTITWPSNFKKAGGALTLSTASGAVDVIKAIYDGTNWQETSRSLNLS